MNIFTRITTFVLVLVFGLSTRAVSAPISMAEFLSLYDDMRAVLVQGQVADPDLSLLRYMRKPRYGAGTWSTVCGDPSHEDSVLLVNYASQVEAIQHVDMQLPNGDLVDCIHFVANLNGFMVGHGDLTGWAGDLVEYSPGYESKTFPDNANFSIMDFNADLDACNVFNTTGANIKEKLHAYYESGKYKIRELLFKTEQTIAQRYNSSNDEFYLMVLCFQKGTNSTNVAGAAAKMEAYIAARIENIMASVDLLNADSKSNNIVRRIDGVTVGTLDQLPALEPGIYVIGGRTVLVK